MRPEHANNFLLAPKAYSENHTHNTHDLKAGRPNSADQYLQAAECTANVFSLRKTKHADGIAVLPSSPYTQSDKCGAMVTPRHARALWGVHPPNAAVDKPYGAG